MITLQDLCSALKEELYNTSIIDHCPNGLQVEGAKEIKRVATAVTASVATIEAALEMKADALVVHHGIFWQGDSYVIKGPRKKRISLLLENNLSLIAWHLPLDVHQKLGNNWKAAKELGWTDLQPFGLHGSVPVGVMGKFPKMKREGFQRKIEEYYGHPAAVALGGPVEVSSAGLVSGGAYRVIPEAAAANLDCFITGNFDEPAWHMAHEEKVNFFALGHDATERVGPKALAQFIQDIFKIEAFFLEMPNPF